MGYLLKGVHAVVDGQLDAIAADLGDDVGMVDKAKPPSRWALEQAANNKPSTRRHPQIDA
jgi:hypothetical protein